MFNVIVGAGAMFNVQCSKQGIIAGAAGATGKPQSLCKFHTGGGPAVSAHVVSIKYEICT